MKLSRRAGLRGLIGVAGALGGALGGGLSGAASPPAAARGGRTEPAPAGAAWAPLELAFGGYYGQGGPASRIAQASYRFAPDGGRYRLDFEVRSGLGQLRFESEGLIDARGLQPERYLEYRQLPFQRPRTREKRFVREAGAGGEDVLLVPPDTQDRLSLVAQVSWLARTQPRSVGPGQRLKLSLAAWNEVDPIELEVEAAEDIRLDGGGSASARRFRRLNDPEQKGALEFWLAEDRQRLPTQISFVDAPLLLRFVRALG